jgi:hypothetical protein
MNKANTLQNHTQFITLSNASRYVGWIDPNLVGIPVADRPPYDEEQRTAGICMRLSIISHLPTLSLVFCTT